MKHFKPTLNFDDITPYLFEGIIFTDDEGFISSINKAVLDFFPRLTKSDLIGKRINDLVPSKDLDLFFENKQEMRNITLSIGMCQLLANFRFIDTDHVLLIVKNITNLQKLSVELNDAHMHIRLFHSILDTIDEGVCFIDNNRKVIFYNRKMGELDSKEPLGVREKAYTTIFKDAKYDQDPLLNSLTVDRKIVQNESFFSNSGKRYIVNRISEPLFLGNKKIGALTTVKDFSKTESMLTTIYKLKNSNSAPAKITSPSEDQTQKTIVYKNKVMKKIMLDAKNAAKSNCNILVHGETGVGKNLLADFIAQHAKHGKPFYSINCGAIPNLLLEESLFGNSTTEGLLERANGGTILLDEVNKMDIPLQDKILRVIQDKKLFKNGKLIEIPLTIQFIALLDEKPNIALKNRRLMEDLFYALSGITLCIPPLRERKEDLAILINHFMQEKYLISEEALTILYKYDYPGNVRQLEYIVEGAVAFLRDEKNILPEHLPSYIYDHHNYKDETSFSNEPISSLPLTEQVEAFEKDLITRMLKKMNAHITNTADGLGISRQSLNYKIRKYEIEIIRGDEC
jgi:arginine utilization regulatory protein